LTTPVSLGMLGADWGAAVVSDAVFFTWLPRHWRWTCPVGAAPWLRLELL